MKSVYAPADKALKQIKRFVNASFLNAVNLMPFDELNVIRVKQNISALYLKLKAQNRKRFTEIVDEAYEEAEQEAVSAGYTADDSVTEDDRKYHRALILAGLLNSANRVTRYAYTNEAGRKRDRLIEAILGTSNRRQMREEFDKAARFWFGQSQQYADLSVDEARNQAFRDMGVQEVEWVAEKDEKTCKTCKALDGQIFPLDAVPDKPHQRCRCYLRPVVRH